MPIRAAPASGATDESAEAGGRVPSSSGSTAELLSHALHDAATGFAVVRGCSHLFVFANSAWQTLAGQVPGPIVGRTLHRASPALATADHLAMLEQVYATGAVLRLRDCEIPAGAGRERRFLSIEHVPLRSAGGRVVAVLMIAQDVTADVLARWYLEDRLADSERRLAEAEAARRDLDALLKYIPIGIAIADAPDLTVRYLSDFGVAMTQRPRQSLERLPADAWQFHHPDGTRLAAVDELPLTRAACNGEVVTNEEWLLRRADGTDVPILCSAGPVYDEAGGLAGGVAVWRDIGRIKQAEAAARESEQRLRLALDAAHMGQAEYHLKTGTLVRMPIVDRLFGFAPGGAGPDGRCFLDRIDPESAAAAQHQIAAALAGGGDVWSVEFRVRWPDGSDHWIAARGQLIRDAAGVPDRIVGVLRDITGRKRHDTAVEALLAEKDALLQQKDLLLREVNHRVKNSLQLVSSLLAMQAMQSGAPEIRDRFAEACSRIATIAQVHETLYRSDSVQVVAFGPYLRRLCEDLEHSVLVDGRHRIIVSEAAETELPVDQAIPLALIVNELVTNACKHARPDGSGSCTVTVAFGMLEDGRYRLIVADDGVGLPDGYDQRSTAGLGMRIVGALVRQLNGTLEVSCREPGARFMLTLPKGSDDSQQVK